MNSNHFYKKSFKAKVFFCLGLSILISISDPLSPLGWGMAKRPPIPEIPKIEIAPPSPEGPIWTLPELVTEALQKNPELYAYKERWKAAKARFWQAISWDDTMIGADFEEMRNADGGKEENIEWMISQKVPFPGKRFLKGRVARKEAKMTQADYQAKEREIVSEIKKAYFEYFLRDHEVRLHEDTKRILERLAKSAESRYATGKMSYMEVLKVHTELATITNEVAKHYQQRETALARLNALIGRNALDPLRIRISVPERTLNYTREDLMKLALENRPELRAMRYGFEAARTDAKAAWLDLMPDAQVRIEARQFSGESGIRETDQFIGFEVPIFSMVGRMGQIREKQAQKRAARGAWENMQNMALFEVQEAWAEFESNDRTARMYESNVVPQAESAFESVLAEYEGGRTEFSTVMDAQKALTEFRHHYFEALAMREQNFADLERVVGMDLGGGVLS